MGPTSKYIFSLFKHNFFIPQRKLGRDSYFACIIYNAFYH
jgi:hypothetical protein